MSDNEHKAEAPIAKAPTMDELRDQARAAMEQDGLSQNAAAKATGIKPATFSQWLSGSYPGNNDKLATAVANWLNRRAASRKLAAVMPPPPVWIETPTARRIMGALAYAQLAGDIACIYGGAGLGKTSAIRRHRETNTNVWVVTATPATASAGVLLEEIAIAMGLRDFPLHPAKLQRAILQQVAGSGGLLVVDEAQNLTKLALEAARALHDASGVGLAYAGNASVYNRMYAGGDNGFAQLFSRVGKRVAVSRASIGDVHAIAEAFGVEGKPELDELEQIAAKPGALRMVVKTLRLAAMGAGGKAIALKHIKAAWRELQGDVVVAETADA
jgi:DNA transposition AAA+ family ATPase